MAFFSYFWQNSHISVKMRPEIVFLKMSWKFVVTGTIYTAFFFDKAVFGKIGISQPERMQIKKYNTKKSYF